MARSDVLNGASTQQTGAAFAHFIRSGEHGPVAYQLRERYWLF